MSENIYIGLFGLGCVGSGLVSVLERNQPASIHIAGACIQDAEKVRPTTNFPLVTDPQILLNDPRISIIVEAINDTEAAWEIARAALENGKHFVTANKALVSQKLPQLIELQRKTGKKVLFEAAVAANIPILQNLENWFEHDWLNGLEGILNGTSNFILNAMSEEGKSYQESVEAAISEGFAELDPTLDVGGYDARYKLNILAAQAFGVWNNPGLLLNFGIQHVNQRDLAFGKASGWKLKQIAFARKRGDSLFSGVLPSFVSAENPLFHVSAEFNGVVLRDAFGEEHFFKGKGAGSAPTGAALYADIRALCGGFSYQWKKYHRNVFLKQREDIELDIYFRYSDSRYLADLSFSEIYESHRSQNHHYVLGRIRLDTLRAFSISEPDAKVFIAQLPESYICRKNKHATRAELIPV